MIEFENMPIVRMKQKTIALLDSDIAELQEMLNELIDDGAIISQVITEVSVYTGSIYTGPQTESCTNFLILYSEVE